MKNVGYFNGKMGPLEEMTVPMNDRAIFFADGCYDATRFFNKTPFAIEDHLDRFYNSCRMVDLEFNMSRETLLGELMRCIEAADDSEGMLYWHATRGTDYRHHDFPDKAVPANLLITVRPAVLTPIDKKLKLITVPDVRYSMCNVKTLNLLPNVIAMQRATEAGCDEVAFVRDGIVTESSHSNIIILKDGVFITHPLDNHILPGITRKHLISYCTELKIPVSERKFGVLEMMGADEIIISSSGILCNAVCEIDGRPVGGKDAITLKKLQDASIDEFYGTTKAK